MNSKELSILFKIFISSGILLKPLLILASPIKPIMCLLRVNFVKTELNEFELDSFINFWKDKVDMIGVQEFIKPTKVKSSIKSKKTIKRKDFKCSFPFKQLVINNEYQVLPCCTFWGEEMPIKKVSKPEDLLDAWNHPKMKDLRKKVSKETAAIVLTNLFNNPKNSREIKMLANKNKITLIEDNAIYFDNFTKNNVSKSIKNILNDIL